MRDYLLLQIAPSQRILVNFRKSLPKTLEPKQAMIRLLALLSNLLYAGILSNKYSPKTRPFVFKRKSGAKYNFRRYRSRKGADNVRIFKKEKENTFHVYKLRTDSDATSSL